MEGHRRLLLAAGKSEAGSNILDCWAGNSKLLDL